MSREQQLTRQHLRGFGLSTYQAIALSKICPIQGKSGTANLYAISDILQSARVYVQKSRIQASTRAALGYLIQQLVQLTNNVVCLPFGSSRSNVTSTIKVLMSAKSETHQFKLRAAALKGSTNV